MVSKIENNYSNMNLYNFKASFIKENGGLNIEKILKDFSNL